MGQHKVPQEYLRHFECPFEPGLIWMYDKKSDRFRKLPIKNVAQASNFYFPDDERMLNEKIEAPAHAPLNKVRRGEEIPAGDRQSVALYLASTAIRGNRAREEKRKILDRDGIGMIATAIRDQNPVWPEREIKQLAERHFLDLRSDREDIVRHQWLPQEMAACMEAMHWTVLMMNSKMLVTADHPLWFTERDGVQKPKGEVVMPLAPNAALILNWSGCERRTRYIRETPGDSAHFRRIAKEVNRRMVFQAERFLFSHERWPWLREMATNPNWNRRRSASSSVAPTPVHSSRG